MTTSSMKIIKFPIVPIIVVFTLLVILFATLNIVGSGTSSTIAIESYGALTPEEIRIIEVVSGHAWQQHGTQVNSALDCLGKKGSTRSFKTSGFVGQNGNQVPTNVWLCFDGFDWYAVVTTIFENVGADKVARLVTAYKISKDLFPTLDDYLSYLKVQWYAREITYAISAGQIFLQPK